MRRRLSFVEKLTFRQEVFLAGGEVVAGTYVQPLEELHAALERAIEQAKEQEVTLAKIVGMQYSVGQQTMKVVEAVGPMGGLMEETRSGLLVEQAARERVEGELASLQGQLLRLKEFGEGTRSRLAEEQVARANVVGGVDDLRVVVDGIAKTVREWDEKPARQEDSFLESRVECVEDTLDGLQIAVQEMVDNEEKVDKKVAAHSGLLKETIKNLHRVRMRVEGAATGEGNMGEPALLGQSVVLCGLQTADLNNQIGTVVGWDREALRYEVVLMGGREARLRPVNLRVLQDCERRAGT